MSSGTAGVLGATFALVDANVSDAELGAAVLAAIAGHEDFVGDSEAAPPFFAPLNFASWHQFDAAVLFECEVEVAPAFAVVRPFGPVSGEHDGMREPIAGGELQGPNSPDCIGMNVRIAFFTTAGERA